MRRGWESKTKHYIGENALTLTCFKLCRYWPHERHTATGKLVAELKDYGLTTIDDLRQIIHNKYAKVAKEMNYRTNIYGLVRDWMILHDHERYRDRAWKKQWRGFASGDGEDDSNMLFYQGLVGNKITNKIFGIFG